MKRSWKLIAVVAVVVLALTSSLAMAATRSDTGRSGSARAQQGPPPVQGKDLSKLAAQLDVSAQDLRDAFDAVRKTVPPPKRPGDGAKRPTKAQMEKRCTTVTDALAKELGKSGDEVRAATKAVGKDDLAQAVKDGRLSQAQADKLSSRIDSATCVFGPPGGHGHGCGGPGGRPPHGAGGPPGGMLPGDMPPANGSGSAPAVSAPVQGGQV
jgi:hypothetical protein